MQKAYLGYAPEDDAQDVHVEAAEHPAETTRTDLPVLSDDTTVLPPVGAGPLPGGAR